MSKDQEIEDLEGQLARLRREQASAQVHSYVSELCCFPLHCTASQEKIFLSMHSVLQEHVPCLRFGHIPGGSEVLGLLVVESARISHTENISMRRCCSTPSFSWKWKSKYHISLMSWSLRGVVLMAGGGSGGHRQSAP